MKPRWIVIHHSATSAQASLEEIRCVHLERGFDDIGYHYLVTSEGAIVSGRAESLPGAHARGVNQESIGICCVGNFDSGPIPPVQFEALAGLVVELACRYDITAERVIGHADAVSISPEATPTRCPGEYLLSRLAELRTRVDLCTQPQLLGSSVSIDVTEGADLAVLTGVLRGRHYRREREKLAGQTRWSRVVLKALGSSDMVWTGQSPLSSDHSEAGGEVFSMNLPHSYLPQGQYECLVFIVDEAGCDPIDADYPLLQFHLSLPVMSRITHERPPLRAHIRAERVGKTGPHIIRVRGSFVNSGTMAWRSTEDYPFRLGAVLVSTANQAVPIEELRYDLSTREIQPGQEVTFSLTFDTGELPLGDYFLHVDVVLEKKFWFSELGGAGESFRFAVSQHRKSCTADLSHLLNPPNSMALAASEASVLYIAPTLPLFDRSTGGRRLIDLFRILRESGVRVTLLYMQRGVFEDSTKYLAALDELGIEHAQDPLGVLSESSAFRGYNLCVIGWYSLAASILPAVREALPGVRIAVDSVDIHWAREELSEKVGLSQQARDKRLEEKQREMRAYSEADEVWVVSESEAAIVGVELPAVKCRVVGVPCAQHPHYVEELSGDRTLFVGGFTHPPNETAALWAAEVLREYNRCAPRPRTLEIVGPQPPSSVRALAQDQRVEVLGFVPSLDEPHRRAKVFLCPMRFGGGVKGKISDAICRGVPVITNAIGNEGLGLRHGEEILLGETTEDFIALLDDVYSGRVDCEALRRNALRALLATYGEDAIRKQLLASFVAPPVVIGIVTYNQRELLKACLNSILAQTNYKNFKIAVISNGCNDGTVEMLKEFAEWYPRTIDAHFSESNDFFVRPCNRIITQYSDSDIVLMNNDVEVTHPGWLTNLVDAAYSASHVCGSGGLIFDSRGLVSEAGAEIYETGLGRNLYRGAHEVSGAANAIRSVGFVSGCLMYMRRDAINRIGALDDDYHPMYFEDVAWHYTAHTAGLKTIYTPWARAVHKEGSTAGQDLNTGMKRYQQINREKFLKKFAGVDLESFNLGW